MTTIRRAEEGFAYAGTNDLAVMACPGCGVLYAIPEVMQANACKQGHGRIQWYCPNGHQLGYYGKSPVEKKLEATEEEVRWQRERAVAERDLREHTEHKLRAQKGATTRAKKRHAAAVCPCCNRSFVQLRRHMQAKHPDYDPAS